MKFVITNFTMIYFKNNKTIISIKEDYKIKTFQNAEQRRLRKEIQKKGKKEINFFNGRSKGKNRNCRKRKKGVSKIEMKYAKKRNRHEEKIFKELQRLIIPKKTKFFSQI